MSRTAETAPEVTVSKIEDLQAVWVSLVVMYRALHTDQPECPEHGPADLMVEGFGEMVNVTQDVPVVIEWLYRHMKGER